MRLYILKEHIDRRKSISGYQGPRAGRINNGKKSVSVRPGDNMDIPVKELQMPKDIRTLQVVDFFSDEEENTENGRQVKVESIGKALGRNREKTADRPSVGSHSGTYRKKKHNSRSDFGKSRKKAESRFKSGKEGKDKKFVSTGYERKKTEARFSGKSDENQYELSEELKRLYESDSEAEVKNHTDAYEIAGENLKTDEGKLIFGEDLTKSGDDRKKVFFNSRRSNYSGTRSERLLEKSRRKEIEDQFQDVVPYIPVEDEVETVSHKSHKWGKLALVFCAFMLLYEIVIIGAVSLNPDFMGNVSSGIVEMKADLEERFMHKEDPEETEPETPSESYVPETELTETAEGVTSYVNESGAIAVQNPAIPVEAEAIGKGASEPVELMFAGDVYLSDHVMEAYRSQGDISGVLSEGYRQEIDSVDYFVANEEFPFSSRGKQAENKQFTFRVPPDDVSIIREMGIDLVTLANNHTLDYGTEALLDTISTLDDAGIRHVGAGSDLNSASESVTVSIKSKKIAFIGATRVIPESNWAATDTGAGVFAAYDDTALLEKIKTAKEQADFVVVYVHWGEERKEKPNEAQTTLAHNIVDAGADLVIGAHPHVLQGIEYYKGVPIAYSLGNFVFGSSIPSTALLRVTIDDAEASETDVTGGVTPEGTEASKTPGEKFSEEKSFDVQLQLIPGKSGAGYTEKLDNASEIASVYSYIAGISTGVSIDGNGVVHQSS